MSFLPQQGPGPAPQVGTQMGPPGHGIAWPQGGGSVRFPVGGAINLPAPRGPPVNGQWEQPSSDNGSQKGGSFHMGTPATERRLPPNGTNAGPSTEWRPPSNGANAGPASSSVSATPQTSLPRAWSTVGGGSMRLPAHKTATPTPNVVLPAAANNGAVVPPSPLLTSYGTPSDALATFITSSNGPSTAPSVPSAAALMTSNGPSTASTQGLAVSTPSIPMTQPTGNPVSGGPLTQAHVAQLLQNGPAKIVAMRAHSPINRGQSPGRGRSPGRGQSPLRQGPALPRTISPSRPGSSAVSLSAPVTQTIPILSSANGQESLNQQTLEVINRLQMNKAGVNEAFQQALSSLSQCSASPMGLAAPEMKPHLTTILTAAAHALSGGPTSQGVQSSPSESTNNGEMIYLLGKLQNDFEQVQKQYSNLIAGLTSQWESRFNELEQATQHVLDGWEQRFCQLEDGVRAGLTAATSTAMTMSERANKFTELGEVLEKALRRVDDGFDKDSPIWGRIDKVEQDVAQLMSDIALEQAERAKNRDVISQAESQINAFYDHIQNGKMGMINHLSESEIPTVNDLGHVPQAQHAAGGDGPSGQNAFAPKSPSTPPVDCGLQKGAAPHEVFADLLKRVRDMPVAPTPVLAPVAAIGPIDVTAPVSSYTPMKDGLTESTQPRPDAQHREGFSRPEDRTGLLKDLHLHQSLGQRSARPPHTPHGDVQPSFDARLVAAAANRAAYGGPADVRERSPERRVLSQERGFTGNT